MEEQQAITRLRQGDISGLETLVRVYQVRAIRAAYLIVRDRSHAEDIVQAAFLRAYDRIAQFDTNRAFGPWFLKSVINDSVKAVTRRKIHVSIERDLENGEIVLASQLTDSTSEPQELLESNDIRHAVWEALDKLTPAQRGAIVMRYFLDFSEAEMVQKMKRPAGTVKWLLYAARKHLRALLRPLRSEAQSQPDDGDD